MSSNEGNEYNNVNNDWARARVKIEGLLEAEFEGPRDFVDEKWASNVDPLINVARELVASTTVPSIETYPEPHQLQMFEQVDTLPDANQNSVPTNTNGVKPFSNNDGHIFEIPSLCELYLKVEPNSQSETIGLITFWYEQYQDQSVLARSDYEEAFRQLKSIGEFMPMGSQLADMIKNAINHAKLIERAGRGQYRLTSTGRSLIAKMSQDNSD